MWAGLGMLLVCSAKWVTIAFSSYSLLFPRILLFFYSREIMLARTRTYVLRPIGSVSARLFCLSVTS